MQVYPFVTRKTCQIHFGEDDLVNHGKNNSDGVLGTKNGIQDFAGSPNTSPVEEFMNRYCASSSFEELF